MAETISASGPVGTARIRQVITFETGKLAGQADGAVTVRLGDTRVLVTATAAKCVREGIDFFPLTVDIEERTYAAGKIPGSFFRREGRASERRHPDLPPDRPAAAPVVPRRASATRSTWWAPCSAPTRQPPRRARHQRGLRRADRLRHPLRRPDRRRAHRLHAPTAVDAHPTYEEGDAASLRDGRRRA